MSNLNMHRQQRSEAVAELRVLIIKWVEKYPELTDVEAATILNAQAYSISNQFLHARVLEEDKARPNDDG